MIPLRFSPTVLAALLVSRTSGRMARPNSFSSRASTTLGSTALWEFPVDSTVRQVLSATCENSCITRKRSDCLHRLRHPSADTLPE